MKLLGEVNDYSVASDADHITSAIGYGNGLLHLNLDRLITSATNAVNTEYVLINDQTNKRISILNLSPGTPTMTTSFLNYTGTAANIEYVIMDGEVRISPWSNGTTPFAVNNQLRKLKFMKTIKTLGIDPSNLSSNLEDQNTYTNVYKSGVAYIAPVKANTATAYGGADGYGYDVFATMGTSSWFKADHDSEATCNTTFEESQIDSTYEYLINRSLQNVTDELDGHANWAQGFGGLELAIWLGSTIDTNSTIYNYNSGDNSYEIFASILYGDQESVPVHIGTVIEDTISGQAEDKTVPMYYNIFGRIAKDPFKTGINYYYAKKIDGEIGQKYLLFEVDYEKGYRKGGEKTYSKFTESLSSLAGDPIFTANGQAFSNVVNKISGNTKKLLSLPDLEPYIEKDESVIGRLGTGYKTATVINRRVYAGNLAYYDKKKDSTSYIRTANDTVIKTPVNEFDYFPLANKIDVEINDGEDIVKLSSVGDKLLEFKQNTLYIVNCSRDIEFLEGTYQFKGVNKQYHVVQGEGFVAWINQFGAYLYDGQNITNLLYADTGQKRLSNWNTAYYHDDNVLGYLPKQQCLFIANKNAKVIFYDLKSGAFFYSTNRFPTNDITNMINLNDGKLVWFERDSGVLKLHYWNDTPAALTLSNDTVIAKTPSLVFEGEEVKKNITGIYINYRQPNSAHVKLQVIPDGGSVTTLETIPVAASYTTRKIAMHTLAAFKGIKSLEVQLAADGSAIDDQFEVNDLQIIHRGLVRT